MTNTSGWSRRALLAMSMTLPFGKVALGAPSTSVKAYRGIRYGRAARFGQTTVVPFQESLIQPSRGPISPQFPSRLEIAMGPMAPMKQDEHCQVLSVFTPSRTGKRPVMVFLHGGAFVTGGGELPWYDGDKLAAEGDVVVVPVTYRLGALGFLRLPGSTGPSPAMSDQIAALQWVKANIAKFGGDPDNVTLFGQSAGGGSISSLIAWGYGGKLFHRGIIESGAGGGGAPGSNRERLEKAGQQFIESDLRKDPNKATIEEILAAQVKSTVGWGPTTPDVASPPNVPIVCGWTREDALPFPLIEQHKAPDPNADLTPFREATENGMFGKGARSLVQRVAAAGQRAYLFQFAWNGPKTGLGDCHTIELPFLLGDRAAWQAAPMLKGADWADIERLGRSMRSQWTSFARSGDPSDRNMRWQPASSTSQPVNILA